MVIFQALFLTLTFLSFFLFELSGDTPVLQTWDYKITKKTVTINAMPKYIFCLFFHLLNDKSIVIFVTGPVEGGRRLHF